MALIQRRTETPTVNPPDLPNGLFRGVGVALGLGMALLILLPSVALVEQSFSMLESLSPAQLMAIGEALALSLGTTVISLGVIILMGTPLAYLLARSQFRGARLLSNLIEIPIVMPPVVAGLALLAAFGRRGLFGAPLAELGISLPFTTMAVVLAQVFVAAPFFIRAAQLRFAAVPAEIEEAAQLDGANDLQVFLRITLPLSLRALATGAGLSWARALGEFGATILFAGNLQGRTQTLPLFIYGTLETDLQAVFVTALFMLVIAVVILGVVRMLTRADERDALAAL